MDWIVLGRRRKRRRILDDLKERKLAYSIRNNNMTQMMLATTCKTTFEQAMGETIEVRVLDLLTSLNNT